jgi:carbon-monoxide dehydrogenase medium subunit
VKPAPFTYHRAADVAQAISLLAELGDEAKILAGGQSLVPMMNFRLARPSALVDISRIAGLSYLAAGPDGLRIGALTRHRTIETTRDAAVLRDFGVLPRSARWIGHYPIRTRGTFGGSIAHADPASEWCLLAVLLQAEVVLQGPHGRRTVPAADFFQGYYTTSAEPDEVIVEVRFARRAPSAVLTEFSYRQGDFAVVAAGVSVDVTDGRCTSVRVVLGGVGPLPVQIDTAQLAGQPAGPATWRAAAAMAATQIDPPSDGFGSAGYRRKLAETLVSRALTEASQVSGAGGA